MLIAFDGFARDDVYPTTDRPNAGAPQQARKTVKGTISDELGDPMPGVNVTVSSNASIGTTSNENGEFSLTVPSDTCSLVFSYIGYKPITMKIGSREVFSIKMVEDSEELGEVTVVAFGTQKKESVSAAITTISPKNLKMPTSNLTTTFAGQIAGMISYQSSGEPGADNADFFIRGVTTFGYNVDPLILVDNIEIEKTELARIQPDDIESFSIMKDAAATALYGARGANGVILIKTKEGQVGKAKLYVRMENNISAPTREIELADPITFMKMHNEAIITRAIGDPLLYSDEKIENTERGLYPLLYPTTNWHDELLKPYTMNQRINVNISGGGDVARYYVSASYSKDNGILEVDNRNNFNNNIDLNIYTLRSNVNVNLTKSTEMKVSLDGTFEDYTGPIGSGSRQYEFIMKANPVLFPAYYPIDEDHKFVSHTMFGNAGDGDYINPYAELVRGYRESNKSTMGAQMEIIQKLDFITEGLRLRALYNTKRYATNGTTRQYSPYYYKLLDHNYITGEYHVGIINPDANGESLSTLIETPTVRNTMYFESSLNYNKKLGDHDVGGQLVFTMRNNTIPANSNDAFTVLGSLPYRNVGLAGRASYAYRSRYFLEGNFGYNGSERFSEQHRWGFFPSVSAGYMISKEKFFEPLTSTITELKLRASYGLVGNDNISSDRFLYLSDVNLSSGSGYSFGYEQNAYSRPGMTISRYANPDISWEVSYKSNVAMELTLWKDLAIVWEYFKERRTNILQNRTTIPYSMGLWANPQANLGAAEGHGTEIQLTHNYAKKDFWIQNRFNFTYAVNKYTKYEDYDYDVEWWKLRVGNSTTQMYGYIAEGLFVDDAEVANSPKQFGSNLVMAGDLKYRDVNGDGIISDRDMVPLGYPTTPEIQYGFGSSFGYKGARLSFFFNGVHNRSFWINYYTVSPFFNTTGSSRIGHNALAKFIADSYWSESNRNPYATWPRLATAYSLVSHNEQRNTWFMRDGAFIRLKQIELGYDIPDKIVKQMKMKNLRVYMTMNNLFTISKFTLWDVEMAGNGLGYPIQRTYNLGLELTF
ncbi:MAG: TonB-dependent receptor [Tannerella sp.]|jgi:TonB-linked SusC/RagA family outer membrane protein|nr:TonB-dependent receptor [Tannerella sp.]